VREVIHNLNADGFDSLQPKSAGGRPPKFDTEQRVQIALPTHADPDVVAHLDREPSWPP
jgi:transposase